MNSINIGTQNFQYHSEIFTYKAKLLKELGVCKSVKKENKDTYDFLLLLIKQNPIYINKKINDLEIQKAKINGYSIFIITDYGKHKVSMTNCINKREKTLNEKYLQSLRSSIYMSMKKYKNNRILDGCDVCKEDKRLEVDHFPIHFQTIVLNFKNINNKIPEKYNYQNSEIPSFSEEDHELKEQFIKYHDSIAQYRMACRQCNMKNRYIKNEQ